MSDQKTIYLIKIWLQTKIFHRELLNALTHLWGRAEQNATNGLLVKRAQS